MEELSEALETMLREAGVTTCDLLDGLPRARRQVYRELYGKR
jgi:hypothetical protein